MSVSVHDPHVHVCQNTYVEVREQFLGIGSFPVLWDSEPELRPSGLQSKHLRSLSHPAYSRHRIPVVEGFENMATKTINNVFIKA